MNETTSASKQNGLGGGGGEEVGGWWWEGGGRDERDGTKEKGKQKGNWGRRGVNNGGGKG